jgi:hypothetical protein
LFIGSCFQIQELETTSQNHCEVLIEYDGVEIKKRTLYICYFHMSDQYIITFVKYSQNNIEKYKSE